MNENYIKKNKSVKKLESLSKEFSTIIEKKYSDKVLSYIYSSILNIPKLDILPDKSVPLDQTSLILAHNAYNSRISGAIMPNQELSLTRLLNAGARGIELDVHWDHDAARLCHEICNYLPIASYNQKLQDALGEIKTWLNKNLGQVVILKLEDYLEKAPPNTLHNIINSTLNTSRIYTPQDLLNNNNTWPSISSMVSMEKQLIIMPQSATNSSLMFDGHWGGNFKNYFNSSTIEKIRPYNYNILKNSTSVLIENGEDGTFIGKFGKFFTSSIAGQMSREEVALLKQNKVNIISLDNIREEDVRFSAPLFPGEQHMLMPIAILAAMLTPPQNSKSWKQPTRILIQMLAFSFLPDEGKVVYNAIERGKSTYYAIQENTSPQSLQSYSKVFVDALYGGVEITMRVGLNNIMMQHMDDSELNILAKVYLNYVAIETILGGMKGIFKKAYDNFYYPTNEQNNHSVIYNVTYGMWEGFYSTTHGLLIHGKNLIWNQASKLWSRNFAKADFNKTHKIETKSPTRHIL